MYGASGGGGGGTVVGWGYGAFLLDEGDEAGDVVFGGGGGMDVDL
jgi:hypothetical protein